MNVPAPRSVDTPELRISYLEFGSSDCTPVILLHGFPDSPVAFVDLIGHLSTGKLRLLVPYLRGFGATEVTSLDLVGGQEAALGHDLLAFADALQLSRFHLVGHDWGARAAYAGSIFAPDRILSLTGIASPYLMYGGNDLPPEQVNSYWYQWFFQLELGGKMMHENAVSFCHQLWRAWSPDWKFSEKEFSAAAAAWKNPQFADTVLHYYRMRWGGALSLRAYASLQAKLNAKPRPSISAPTLYIAGDADNCVLPAASEDQAPSFTGSYNRILLKGLGHFPHREDPKAVAKLLTRHLEKQTHS